MIFQKINHIRTADAVVHQMEALILEGILRPGDRLPAERDLCKQVDVSRPILREAIKILEEKGLLTTRHGGGTFVSDIIGTVFAQPVIDLINQHPKALLDYLEFRRDIEGITASYAAVRATDDDRKLLTEVHDRMKKAHEHEDPWEEATLDVDFHHAVSECAHNIMLLHTLRSYYRLLADGVFFNRTRLYAHQGSRDQLLDQHTALYKTIMARDSDGAKQAAEDHMTYVITAMQDAERRASWQDVSSMRLHHAQDTFLSTPLTQSPRKKTARADTPVESSESNGKSDE